MAQQLILSVEGPFSLAAAASFGFGPHDGRPSDAAMRLAFVADDLESHTAATIRQQPGGDLAVSLAGDAGPDAAAAQIRRILSVDADPAGWLAAGRADPVLGGLQAEHAGQRPVLFHSPYEAAAWSVLSQRRQRAQATVLRRRLAEAHGAVFDLDGERLAAFPQPRQLLAVAAFPGIEEQRLARLHGVAKAALDGELDPAALRAMDSSQAMSSLRGIKGLGPVYAMLVYLRSTGVTDGLALGEPRLAACLRHFYELPAVPDNDEITRLAEPWRPFRTWAGVLFRVAGDRAGLPLARPPGRR
jgi:DNA-3-methyladenine glycosylase II